MEGGLDEGGEAEERITDGWTDGRSRRVSVVVVCAPDVKVRADPVWEEVERDNTERTNKEAICVARISFFTRSGVESGGTIHHVVIDIPRTRTLVAASSDSLRAHFKQIYSTQLQHASS